MEFVVKNQSRNIYIYWLKMDEIILIFVNLSSFIYIYIYI